VSALNELSIEEIRERYLDQEKPVSAHVLARLQRDPRQGARKLYVVLKKRFDKQREERLRITAMLHFEQVLWKSGVIHIAGVDEVGMGPLAGPVVAAAVVFEPGTEIEGVDDSKRLDPARRQELAEIIRTRAKGVGIGLAEVEEIDRLNIYHAGLLAMKRAVEALPMRPQHVLVDARTIAVDIPQNTFNKGDGINFTIAAASIVAKTHRDRLMEDLDRVHPGYGFAAHKGYSTLEHRKAVMRLGPCLQHRKSFPVIHELCGEYSGLFYELRRQLDIATSRELLGAFEAGLEARVAELKELECRKLKLLIGRRWKTIGSGAKSQMPS
jgi:ribonuclease HII